MEIFALVTESKKQPTSKAVSNNRLLAENECVDEEQRPESAQMQAQDLIKVVQKNNVPNNDNEYLQLGPKANAKQDIRV